MAQTENWWRGGGGGVKQFDTALLIIFLPGKYPFFGFLHKCVVSLLSALEIVSAIFWCTAVFL